MKSWCNTQSIVSLSSCEVEYYAMVMAGAQLLRIGALKRDMGIEYK